MITKIKDCYFDGRRKNFIFPAEYVNGRMMNARQRRTLTNLIFENFMDDEREQLLSQINEFSAEEADNMIMELATKW